MQPKLFNHSFFNRTFHCTLLPDGQTCCLFMSFKSISLVIFYNQCITLQFKMTCQIIQVNPHKQDINLKLWELMSQVYVFLMLKTGSYSYHVE